jgi:hypothetical protein
MGKAIGSAIAGYIVSFVAMFGLMTAAWAAVGVEGAFQPEGWEISTMWLGLLLAAGLVAAVAGGYVTALLSSDPLAIKLLLGIVVVLGIVFALPVLMGTTPAAPLPRPDDVPMFEAMANGKQPKWAALVPIVLSAIGVVVGAKLRGKGK